MRFKITKIIIISYPKIRRNYEDKQQSKGLNIKIYENEFQQEIILQSHNSAEFLFGMVNVKLCLIIIYSSNYTFCRAEVNFSSIPAILFKWHNFKKKLAY